VLYDHLVVELQQQPVVYPYRIKKSSSRH